MPPLRLITGLRRARPRPLAGDSTLSRPHAFLVTSAGAVTETTPFPPIDLAGARHSAPTHHGAELGVIHPVQEISIRSDDLLLIQRSTMTLRSDEVWARVGQGLFV